MNEIEGYLEIHQKGFGFLRAPENNLSIASSDVFVSPLLIKSNQLRSGNFIEGESAKNKTKSASGEQLTKISKINGLSEKKWHKVKPIKSMTSINPEEKLSLTLKRRDRTGKVMDLITPVGKGQRGLIIAPPKTGKTTILKHLAQAVEKNHPEIKVYVLLVDERPEEVTDFKRSLKSALVFSSSADESVESHLRITDLVMNMAMRDTETGKDVLVLIDSLTRMGRAFNKETNSRGRTLSGGLAANALDLPRRFFGAARNIEHGGSLTIMATILVDTGSRMDEVIFQEFKGTGNLDLALSQKCAEQRIFPAININASGTRKEELLLDEDNLRKSYKIRRSTMRQDEVDAMMQLIEYVDSY